MRHRLAWCIALGLVVGIGALAWFGVRAWTIALALLMLVCPAVILWLLWYAHASFPGESPDDDRDGADSRRPGGR